jgi:hypothetical protein
MYLRDFIKPRTLMILIGLLILCLGCGQIFLVIEKGLELVSEAPFDNPPNSFKVDQLVGSWMTKYSNSRTETLIIQPGGKFTQIYEEGGNIIQTNQNYWWIEPLDDGRIYLHLEGARYYADGAFDTKINHAPCPTGDIYCEEMATKFPIEGYDWIGKDWVDMANQLILNIRMDSSGDILLLHLWKSSDRGFPIIGGEAEIFRKQ